MKRTGATLTGSAIPFVWRLRMMLHGVRLSRLADDEPTTGCDGEHLTYRVTMADENLVGLDSAPLVVRINLRAASFVLRGFAQQTAELRADRSGALIALYCAPDGASHPIATHATKASERATINGTMVRRAGWTGHEVPSVSATAGGVNSAACTADRGLLLHTRYAHVCVPCFLSWH